MDKKITSVKNPLCRRIIIYAYEQNFKTCYPLLFNNRTRMDEFVFLFLFALLLEICPINYLQFKELHPQIQSYMNNYYEKLQVKPRFN